MKRRLGFSKALGRTDILPLSQVILSISHIELPVCTWQHGKMIGTNRVISPKNLLMWMTTSNGGCDTAKSFWTAVQPYSAREISER